MAAPVDLVANFVTGNSSFLSLIHAGGGGEVHKVKLLLDEHRSAIATHESVMVMDSRIEYFNLD